jgi:hypothetical protein
MAEANQKTSTQRFKRSCVYATVAVIASTVAVLVLVSLENPGRSSSRIDFAADILGFPLLPGWLVITGIFGNWGAVHGGQILLVPFVSLGIDTGLIFVVWEFFHRKASRGLDSDNTLHINR